PEQMKPEVLPLAWNNTSWAFSGYQMSYLTEAMRAVQRVQQEREDGWPAPPHPMQGKPVAPPRASSTPMLVAAPPAQNHNPHHHTFGSRHMSTRHPHPLEYRENCGYASGRFSCDLCMYSS